MLELRAVLKRCALALTVGVGGCAASAPSLSGAGITPRQRVDIGVGSAFRVPFGQLRERETTARAGGPSPVAFARAPLSEQADVRLAYAGSLVSGQARYALRFGDDGRVLLAAEPHAGWRTEDDEEGTRFGGLLSAAAGLSAGGVYELWIGPRAGFERFEGGQRQASVWRAGGVLGVAVGFRRLHGLLELAADYEWWRDATAPSPRGLVLTPTAALRLRL